MPVEYSNVVYDFRIDVPLAAWLKAKDDQGWEFIAFCPKDYSNLAWQHIVMCIFRRKL